MKVIKTQKDLQNQVYLLKAQNQSIGFVPTMGALHEGHLSLIRTARQQCDSTISSIFVNPTQFNDPKDLANYPRNEALDLDKLREANCDFVFIPDITEVYSPNEYWHFDIGKLEQIFEGTSRPGHYQGVTQIVKKFFDWITPNIAFFGQKDYQQFLIIRQLVSHFGLPVQLFCHPTIRESNGLAMSSRNARLNEHERQIAQTLSRTLFDIKAHFADKSIKDLLSEARSKLTNTPELELSYLSICDAETLEETNEKTPAKIIALLAARIGEIRLIDNIILKS